MKAWLRKIYAHLLLQSMCHKNDYLRLQACIISRAFINFLKSLKFRVYKLFRYLLTVLPYGSRSGSSFCINTILESRNQFSMLHRWWMGRKQRGDRWDTYLLPFGTARDVIMKLTYTAPLPWPISVTFDRSPPNFSMFSCKPKWHS